MRKLLIAMPLILAGCVGVTTAGSLLSRITTDLNAACTSANVLALQAADAGLAGAGAALQSVTAKPCGKIGTASAQAQVWIDTVNTAAAVLLGIAGSAGVNLPGLK